MRKHLSPLFVCALVSALAPPALAATWTNPNSGGLWSNAANWSPSIPSGIDATADFSTLNLLADNTVHLDTPRIVGTLLFADTTPSNNWFLDNNANTSNTLSLTVSAGTPVINVANQSATIAASIIGSQGFNKTGTGKLILSATNTFTGIANLSAGTLVVANASALGAGGSSANLTFVGAGTAHDLNGQNNGHEFHNPLHARVASCQPRLYQLQPLTPASLSGTINSTFAGNFSVGGTGSIFLSGGFTNASGNSTLNKIGNNTLFLAGNSDNTGLTVNVFAGSLFLEKSSSASVHAIGPGGLTISGGSVTYLSTGSDQIADSANVSISSGQLDLDGFSDTINTLSIQGTGLNNAGALQNSAVSLTSALTANKIQLTGDTTIGIPQSSRRPHPPGPHPRRRQHQQNRPRSSRPLRQQLQLHGFSQPQRRYPLPRHRQRPRQHLHHLHQQLHPPTQRPQPLRRPHQRRLRPHHQQRFQRRQPHHRQRHRLRPQRQHHRRWHLHLLHRPHQK